VGSNPTPGAMFQYAVSPSVVLNPRVPNGPQALGAGASELALMGLWLRDKGYRPTTIVSAVRNLKILGRKADLADPDVVRRTIAVSEWSDGFKRNLVNSYGHFADWKGYHFERPFYEPYEKLPFIPLESELDSLISGCGRKTSTVLQLLKETGARIGEALMLEWQDVDFERQTVTICPEKNSRPRQFKITAQLLGRLSRFDRKNKRVFGSASADTVRREYERQRKRLAEKLGNARLQQIKLHTFRHWKATYEYHRTKDILYVMRILGHRAIKNTLKYTQLVDWKVEDYVCKAARTLEEATGLIESGFEYVTELDNVKLFRKRK